MSDPDRHQLAPLLERLLQGDRVALNDLFARLRPYLHTQVRKTLGAEWKDSSDIVQSSLRRINEHMDDWLGGEPSVQHLLAWINRIVHNRAIDEVRRRKNVLGPGQEAFLDNLPEPTSGADRETRESRAGSLFAALARLPERHRQVVEMHYFDRLRDEEISRQLGGSVAAVRVLRCRALKQLRALLESADVDR
jgi:RNA polymerase sigma-70 factor (ECF subfamily)